MFFLRMLLILFLTCYSMNSMGIYVDSDILVIESDEEFASRSFLNDSRSSNVYAVSMYKIDRPGKAEKSDYIESGEVMFAPLKLMVDPGKTDYFKVYYQGPKDDNERYYRIILKETAAKFDKSTEDNGKQGHVFSSVGLDTYVVVRPRNIKFQYDYQQNAGSITNTGNTFFRVLLHTGCDAEDEPAIFDVLPGETLKNRLLSNNNRSYIVTKKQFISLSKQCPINN